MKLIKSTIYIIFLIVTISAVAQQDPHYTFYRYNMNLVNPAYAGTQEKPEIGINLRSQWSGVQGGPETQSIFFGTNVGNNVGLGISIINDKTFIENQTALFIDFSYELKINQNTNLYLGLKAGTKSYNANTEGLTTFNIESDPSLMNIDGGFSPNIGAGAYIKGEKYFVSLSVPRILTPNRLEQKDGLAKLGIDRIHMYFSAGYDIQLSKKIVFKPSFMTRYVNAAPLSIDITPAFLFNQRFELGVAYRLNEGIGGYLLINATSWVDFGYAYESALESPIAKNANGTHEIFLKFSL